MENKKLVNSHTFEINLEVNGEPYIGKFTVHRPTIQEVVQIGVREARELMGLSNIDPITSMLAHEIATLEAVVDLKPEWWKPRELRDAEVLQAVYDAYIDYLSRFQGRSKTESSTNS